LRYIGKGDANTYWRNTGRLFGFPECCIEAFIKEELPIWSPFDGTGFRPCESCLDKGYEEMVNKINSRRTFPKPFPDSSGFAGSKYQEDCYSEIQSA
jgi:hypothetical protein